MGNLNIKGTQKRNEDRFAHSNREDRIFRSQFSVSHFAGNFSGRSYASVLSNQSVYSASRPWSRVSRRRWNESTLNNPLESSKTAWPVSNQESVFLPEFPISAELVFEFEVKETIARGAFGEVNKVQSQSDNKEYALKILNKHQILNESAVKQVKEEANIQAACGHHSFIAGFVARWQTKKNIYIEYIPGGELLALLEKYGKLPEDLVKIFVAEIAIALDFLHNAGVIYRDLKPENILLDSEYHIKIIDFGLSKWLSIGSRTNTLCGTLKYMAPEVISREPYGHAVDWWSLGVIACRMLINEFPTPAIGADVLNGSARSIERSSLTQATPGLLPESAGTLSKAARGLLMRLLDKDPKCRLRNLRQLQQTAFYLGTDFKQVENKKISPRSVLEMHFPTACTEKAEMFPEFDSSDY